MAGQVLRPEEYKLKVAKVSKAWKELPQDDKEAYSLEAAHQQKLREDLAATPLLSKAEEAEPESVSSW